MKVITEQHYKNKYLGYNPHLTRKQKDKDAFSKQVANMGFNYFAVYRPKLSKLNIKTVDKFINEAIAKYELLYPTTITKVYYTLEYDRYLRSYHLNLLIKGSDVSKRRLATAMKRNSNEIGYLEKIECKLSASTYVNKHLNKVSKGVLYGFIDAEQVVNNKLFANEVGYRTFDNHPNKKYHLKAKRISSYVYDWKANSLV
jgi:hypothetical protein